MSSTYQYGQDGLKDLLRSWKRAKPFLLLWWEEHGVFLKWEEHELLRRCWTHDDHWIPSYVPPRRNL